MSTKWTDTWPVVRVRDILYVWPSVTIPQVVPSFSGGTEDVGWIPRALPTPLFFLFFFFLFPVSLLLDDMALFGTCFVYCEITHLFDVWTSGPTRSKSLYQQCPLPRVGSARHGLVQCSWISRDSASEPLTFIHVIATSFCHPHGIVCLFRPRTVIESDVPDTSVARNVVWIALGMSSREADRLRRRQVIHRIIRRQDSKTEQVRC